jgi:hypothetical protein
LYNRYIPQPDGSFRRNRVQAQEQQQKPQPPQHEPEDEPQQPPNHPISAGSFLKQLIPKGLDTGDLLIIVLLLLMAGECEEEKNSALLTLALYLFM